jgi:hypothetical protein
MCLVCLFTLFNIISGTHNSSPMCFCCPNPRTTIGLFEIILIKMGSKAHHSYSMSLCEILLIQPKFIYQTEQRYPKIIIHEHMIMENLNLDNKWIVVIVFRIYIFFIYIKRHLKNIFLNTITWCIK